MYIILERDTSRLLAIQDAPYYVHVGRNGTWQSCSAEDAEALSIKGVRYSLPDKPPTTWEVVDPAYNPEDPESVPKFHEEEAPVVIVSERTDGELIFDQIKTTDGHTIQISDLETGAIDLADAVDVHTVQISDLETGAIDLADAVDAHTGQITDIETGAIDLADAVDTHTGQITDLETGTLDLADAVDTATVGTETALLDLGDNVALLMERIEALEDALK